MYSRNDRRIIQRIFQSQEKRLLNSNQPLKNIKAITSIARCQTPQNGVSVYRCKEDHEVERNHSCRHRSCSICAEQSRSQWIDSIKQKIFDHPHFHVVFTLPHEYLELWRFNEKWFGQTFFKIVSALLMEMIGNRYHIRPGLLMAQHTWGRNLALHPHLHCLVSAGGQTNTGEWKDIGEFFLPIRAVKLLYRTRFQMAIKAAFKQGELCLPDGGDADEFWRRFIRADRKSWHIRIEERYEHGKGVLLYIARYLKGGPLNPHQIGSMNHKEVEFRYKDHREQRIRSLRLPTSQLLQRLLQHVPVKGFHTVRCYGLYSSNSKSIGEGTSQQPPSVGSGDYTIGLRPKDLVEFCRTCGAPMGHSYIRWPLRKKEISLLKNVPRSHVQQGDETDIATLGFINSS